MATAKTPPSGGSDAPDLLEETFKIMELSTERERELFLQLKEWCPSFSHLKVAPLVGAALLCRLLSSTEGCVDSTARFPPPESKDTQSPTNDPNKLSTVTPDDTTTLMDIDDDKQDGIVIVGANESSSPILQAEKTSAKVPAVDSGTKSTGESSHEDLLVARPESITGLGTDLAKLLVAIERHNRKEDPKGPTHVLSMPTVAYIAAAYMSLFKNRPDGGPSVHASAFVRTVIGDHSATKNQILKYSDFLQQSLQALTRSSKASVETYCDFEYLWSSCAGSSAFRQSITKWGLQESQQQVNENGKRPAATGEPATVENVLVPMKFRSWKLSCLAATDQDVNFSLDKKDDVGRRRSILISAACLGLLSFLPNVPIDDDEEVGPPGSKKARTMEEDAIAALNMMVKGKYKDKGAPEDPLEPLQVVVACANTLLSTLRAASPTFNESLKPISMVELDGAVVGMAKQIMSTVNIGGQMMMNGGESNQMTVGAARKDDAATTNGPPPKWPASSSKSKVSPVVWRLKSLLPTTEQLKPYIEMSAIDKLLSVRRQQAVDRMREDKPVTFQGFPLVDEPCLVYTYMDLIPRLCMASSKASSSGVALAIECDGNAIMKSQEGQAAAAMAALMGGDGSESSSDRDMRDVMELNEWTVSILSISAVQPSTRLQLYLEASDDESIKKKRKRADGVVEEVTVGNGWKSVIPTVLNRIIGRMIEGAPNPTTGGGSVNRRLAVMEENGTVVVNGDDDDVEIKLCQALIALYYQSLESILYYETARLKSASHPTLVLCEPFHRALLTCCCICLMKGLCSSSALALSEKYLDLDFPCIQHIMESCPYTFLKVSESFARAVKLDKPKGKLRSPFAQGLPRILQKQLSQCEVLVIDSLLWKRESSFVVDISIIDVVKDIKSIPNHRNVSTWPPEVLRPTLPEEIDDNAGKPAEPTPKEGTTMKRIGPVPPDHLYLSYVIRKLLKIAFFRISAFCNALEIPPECPIASQVWVAFRYLLRHHIDLLYDRHVDQLILCTLYGVCKIMKYEPDLSFSNIIECYAKVRGCEIGDRACHRLVRHIKLIPDDFLNRRATRSSPKVVSTSKKQYGNVIQLYNDVFVPAMKNHLLESKSLKKATTALQKAALEAMAARDRRQMTPTPTQPLLTARDRVMAAQARAERLAQSSGSWANEPETVPVQEGNVKLNVVVPSHREPIQRGPTKIKLPRPGKESVAFSPTTRTFYSFGEAAGRNMALMNLASGA